MALRSDRDILAYDITYYMNETGARGGVVSVSTAGSGSALDDGANVCHYASTGSGVVPLGILGCDVVNIDQSKFHVNYQKMEANINEKVTIYTKGWVVTDVIDNVTPTVGQTAYFTADGELTNVDGGGWSVGFFASTKDADGFAKLNIQILPPTAV